MNLEKKKALVARSLNVGKGRIVFNVSRLNELKEAITKQDIRDLREQGVILIKEKKGRKKIKRSKTRRRAGSVKKKVNFQKRKYIILTRKLRSYLKNLKGKKKISQEEYSQLRREIRASLFKDLSHFRERIASMREDK